MRAQDPQWRKGCSSSLDPTSIGDSETRQHRVGNAGQRQVLTRISRDVLIQMISQATSTSVAPKRPTCKIMLPFCHGAPGENGGIIPVSSWGSAVSACTWEWIKPSISLGINSSICFYVFTFVETPSIRCISFCYRGTPPPPPQLFSS